MSCFTFHIYPFTGFLLHCVMLYNSYISLYRFPPTISCFKFHVYPFTGFLLHCVMLYISYISLYRFPPTLCHALHFIYIPLQVSSYIVSCFTFHIYPFTGFILHCVMLYISYISLYRFIYVLEKMRNTI